MQPVNMLQANSSLSRLVEAIEGFLLPLSQGKCLLPPLIRGGLGWGYLQQSSKPEFGHFLTTIIGLISTALA